MLATVMAVIALNLGITRVEPAPTMGWNDAVRLTNGHVDVVVAPEVGRVIRYGYVDGPNVLWVPRDLAGKTAAQLGAWQNFGGDKLWNAPQSAWNWPPDLDLDGSIHRLEVRGTALRLISPLSSRAGIRFERDIRLNADGTRVDFVNRMRNTSDVPRTWGLWQVTNVDRPTVARMRVRPTPAFPQGFSFYPDNPEREAGVTVRDGWLTARRHPSLSWKLGAPANPFELEASGEWGRLVLRAEDLPGKGEFPDEGRARQLYSNPDALPYMELEVADRVVTLQPGEIREFRSSWTLFRR